MILTAVAVLSTLFCPVSLDVEERVFIITLFDNDLFHNMLLPTDGHGEPDMINTCMKQTAMILRPFHQGAVSLNITETAEDQRNTCGYNFDEVYAVLQRDPITEDISADTSWRCEISDMDYCDGNSVCLTDECGCEGVDVFYCADNSGCIDMDSLCNGINDCPDNSDECFCHGFIEREILGVPGRACLSVEVFCGLAYTLTDDDDQPEEDREMCEVNDNNMNGLEKCLSCFETRSNPHNNY